ncbi:hypothetical protein ANO14919_133280 [Xylariales sp. No.14919]|nr:hypothetical protein ANO14919_133280 [Xylariales sp. No.14919]
MVTLIGDPDRGFDWHFLTKTVFASSPVFHAYSIGGGSERAANFARFAFPATVRAFAKLSRLGLSTRLASSRWRTPA